MNVVHEEVLALVQKEHDAATEKYGPIASLHEGYAVLLEEMQETKEAINQIEFFMDELWRRIRWNQADNAMESTLIAKEWAEQCACEAIQVAAVCRRIMDLCNTTDHEE